MKYFSIALTLISAFASQSFAFQATSVSSPKVETKLFSSELDRYSYGETSRQYRRTVFTHDDWVKHRSSDRFLRHLANFGASGIYKNIDREVFTTVGVAAFVVLYNAVVGGYEDFGGVKHAALVDSTFLPMLTLPLTPFTLSSPSLGLLLVFRTNTSYQRWDEARKNWGMNINHTRDLVRKANSFYDSSKRTAEERERDLQQLSLATWSFVRAMKRHLSPEWEDEAAFEAEIRSKLPQAQADAIINAAHRPNRALFDLSVAIENLPMHFLRKNEVQKSVSIFEDNLGSSERILTSPVPLFYSRHLSRFIFFWLATIPFALYQPLETSWNHIALLPVTAILSLFLFGIEELAAQMEEPFTILPMQAFCDKIGNWCNEILSWSPGDNGMEIKEPRPEHYVVWNTDSGMPNGATMSTNGAANGEIVDAAAEEKSRLRRILGN